MLIVTAAVPLDVIVTDLLTAVPTETLPKAKELALRLSDGVAAFSCMAKLLDELLAVAVMVAVCVVVTDATLAVKEAADEPAGTTTLAGTVTALTLLVTATLWPADGAGALSDTVQVVDPDPAKELPAHVNPLIEGPAEAPVPVKVA